MQNTIDGRERIKKSAEALKTYFERKLQVGFEFLSEPPFQADARDIRLSSALAARGLWGLRAKVAVALEHHDEIRRTFEDILAAREIGKPQLRTAPSAFPPNVLAFKRRKTVLEFVPVDARRNIQRDCLMQCESVGEAHKMAFELHGHGRRYAFLDFRDLDPEARTRLADLKAMGAMTVFVHDILSLNAAEQAALKALVRLDASDRPLIMAVTAFAPEHLRGERALDRELYEDLARVYLKLSRPFREYKDLGLIQYFLDSLSPNPT